MVTITLEMVDEVRNRTGVDYKTAKEALELYEGDVLEAIIYLDSFKSTGEKHKSDFSSKTGDMMDQLKDLVNKGIVTKILVLRKDRVIMDIPVLAGGLAAFVFAPATITAIVAAVATGCVLKIVKEDGEEINLNEKTQDAFKTVVETTENTFNSFTGKGSKEKPSDEEKKEDETVADDDIEIDIDVSKFANKDDDDQDYIVEARFMEHGGEADTEEDKK